MSDSSVFSHLSFEQFADYCGLLTINRPLKLNALNNQLFEELDTFIEGELSNNLRVLVITGAGEKSFVAGADIAELKGLSAEQAEAVSRKGQQVFQKIEEAPYPVIAAINGFALGGGLELALSCSFRLASDTARFGLPEAKLGLMPGYGGTQRLSAIVGLGHAIEMVATGDMVKADKALQMGLVNRLYSAEQLLEEAKNVAQTIAKNAPLAVNAALSATRMSVKGADFETEARIFGTLFETADASEGIHAFLEKRSPSFNGN